MTPGTVTLIVLGVRTSTPRTTNTTVFVVPRCKHIGDSDHRGTTTLGDLI